MEPTRTIMDWNQFPLSNRAARDERRITLINQSMNAKAIPSTSQSMNAKAIPSTSQSMNAELIPSTSQLANQEHATKRTHKNKSKPKPFKKLTFAFFQRLVPPKPSIEETRVKIPVSEYLKGDQLDAVLHIFKDNKKSYEACRDVMKNQFKFGGKSTL